MEFDVDKLIQASHAVRKNAYTPFSHFNVGAALLCDDGSVYCGCNIENSSYSPTICAERAAFASALSAGKRKFVAIAITSDGTDDYISPCGVCRQFMYEFCHDGNFSVIMTNKKGAYIVKRLEELLPYGFILED